MINKEATEDDTFKGSIDKRINEIGKNLSQMDAKQIAVGYELDEAC